METKKTAAVQAPVPSLKVGLELRVPFAMTDGKGGFAGVAVDLWREVAHRMKVPFEFVEIAPGEGVHALEQGRVQVAFLAKPISAADEKHVDYSTPFFKDRDAVAIKKRSLTPSLWNTVKLIFSIHFLDVFLYLVVVFAVAGVMIWVVERKHNSSHFRRSAIKGVGDGLWWAIVTITTIGYGDKVAQTYLGRAISTFWIIFGILLTSIITAAFASTVTINNVKFSIQRVEDLRGLKTGVIAGTESERTLMRKKIPYTAYRDEETGLGALNAGQEDVFFGNLAALDYEIKMKGYDDVVVRFLGVGSNNSYAFAVPERNHFLEEINIAIIEVLDGTNWQEIQLEYGL